jgi:hypothetical protein
VAPGKIAHWWPLLGVVLLALAGGVLYEAHSRQPQRLQALAPDTVAVGPVTAGKPAPSLGMGSDIPDDLDVSFPPGSAIAPALRAVHLSLLRFGDLAADSYDWETDCSYGNDGRFPECGVGAGNGTSFDHFLRFAQVVGAQALIVVNGEIDDPQNAARMVRYYEAHCVHTGDGACVQPYWEIGFSPANWRHFAIPLPDRRVTDASVIQPDQYAALVISYAAAMQQAAPPGVHLKIVADEWITGATDQSWVAWVSAIDTHYAPLQSIPGTTLPSPVQVARSPSDGYAGRPGIDTWLQDLRSSLAQFTNSDRIGIIIGRWSIDANEGLNEPGMYRGYLQAVFTANLLAHLWEDAASSGPNPLLAAIQYPLIGSSQEPFDPAAGIARPAMRVYHLINSYMGNTAVPVQVGRGLQAAGVTAAAGVVHPGLESVLLVNTARGHTATVHLQGASGKRARMWWIVPRGNNAAAASQTRQRAIHDGTVTLPPWAVAIVQISGGTGR